MLALLSPAAFASLQLSVPATPVLVGDVVDLSVSGGQANETLQVVVSARGLGAGPCPAPLGGLCFGIVGPLQVVGTIVTDNKGAGSTQIPVPLNAPANLDYGVQLLAWRGGVAPELSNAASVRVDAVCQTLEGEFNTGPSYDDLTCMGGPDELFAMRYTPAADVDVGRIEVFTGEVPGPSSVAVWTDVNGRPGVELASGSFDLAVANGWQGANLPAEEALLAGVTYWFVWAPTNCAQAPWDSTGSDLVTYTASFDGGLTWGNLYADHLKLRFQSCP